MQCHFVCSVIVASSTAVLAAPAAGSPIDTLKANIRSVYNMYADDFKPYLNSMASNPHILGCSMLQKNECKKFESALNDKEHEIIVRKIAGAFPSKVSENVDRSDRNASALIAILSKMGVAFSAIMAVHLANPVLDIGTMVLRIAINS